MKPWPIVTERRYLFTLHVGRMCDGSHGFLFRWFGSSDIERFRLGWSA